jgi:hypothetical protein
LVVAELVTFAVIVSSDGARRGAYADTNICDVLAVNSELFPVTKVKTVRHMTRRHCSFNGASREQK